MEFRSIVLGLGFSPASHGEVRVTLEIPNRTGLTTLTAGRTSGSTSGPLTYMVSAVGKTPGEAMTKIQGGVQTDLYLGQVQLVAWSSRLKGHRLELVQDYMTRLGPMDKTAYIVATPSVSKLFEVEPIVQEIPVLDLVGGFSCGNCETTTYRQHQWDVQIAEETPGDSIWMPYVITNAKGFETNRIIVYHNFTPATIFSPKESMMVGYLLGRTGKGYFPTTFEGYTLGVRTIKATPKVSVKDLDGHLHLSMKLHMTGTLDDWTGPALTPLLVRQIQQYLDQTFAQNALQVLEVLQKDEVAPNGWMASYLWRTEPGLRDASAWQAAYRQADLSVHVKFTLNDVGDSD